MSRQIQVSDLVVLSNNDGHFMYIRPDIPRPDVSEVISDVARSQIRSGLRVDEEVQYGKDILLDEILINDVYYGIHHSGATNDYVENFNFNGVDNSPLYGAAIFRAPGDQGAISYLRVHADGELSPMADESFYGVTNTDFFNNQPRQPDVAPNEYVMMRDVTAKNFSDAIFDSKSTIYIMNATLENAFRLLRPWIGSEIVLVNCEVNLGPEGSEYVFFNNSTAKIKYYNTTWDGESRPNFNNISFTNIHRSKFVDIYKNNIIELQENPLAKINDFFKEDTSRYRAQVSVNGDTWRELALPEDGWLGRVIGDTLVELPDLGNGVYRVRTWTIDGAPTSPVVSAPVVVTTSSFNYARGSAGSVAPTQPFATTGTADADRLRGDAAANLIAGLAGDDTITGGAGADVIYGGDGGDLLSGDAGGDTLIAGAGADILFGDDGDDILLGGAGRDTLVGGSGSDTADFRYTPLDGAAGLVIDLRYGNAASRSAPSVAIDRFVSVENLADSVGDDVVRGTTADNRLTSGRGNDTITGGGGQDVFIFDNRVDIGSDRITDFTWGRQIWLTHYTDLGSDRAVELSGGKFWVDVAGLNTGNVEGDRAIDIGTSAGGWFRYVGQNAEGYFVYTFLTGTKPARDVLPTEQYDGALTGPKPLPAATPPNLPPLQLDPPPANLPEVPTTEKPAPFRPVIDVFVAGFGGPTVGPAFTVYADGVRLGSGQVADPVAPDGQRLRDFDYEKYSFAFAGKVPSTVEVRFTNDGVESGVNRDLIVDRILVAGVEFKTILESIYIADNPANRGDTTPTSRAIWNGKFVYDTAEAAAEAGTVLRVTADGTGFGGDTPSFNVVVDGVVVGGASIETPITNAARRSGAYTWETFEFQLRDPTPSRVEIVYYNDDTAANGEDLNLSIEKIAIGDTVLEARIDGFYTPDNPERWSFAGPAQNMAWNGVMAFDLA